MEQIGASTLKNIIFHIRVVDGNYEGISMDGNWLNVYLENMKPFKEEFYYPFKLKQILTP